jgi:biotin operon repressor
MPHMQHNPIQSCLTVASALAEGAATLEQIQAKTGLSRTQLWHTRNILQTLPSEGFGLVIEKRPGRLLEVADWGIINPAKF